MSERRAVFLLELEKNQSHRVLLRPQVFDVRVKVVRSLTDASGNGVFFVAQSVQRGLVNELRT